MDEIHNVSLATRPGAEASDMLKYFSERIPATVYAGIDVERNGLLSGTRGEQIAGRFGMIRTSAFPCGEYWTGLISALEGGLRLHHHEPGTLAGLGEYLHGRTSGMIGSLLRLIRGAAYPQEDGTAGCPGAAVPKVVRHGLAGIGGQREPAGAASLSPHRDLAAVPVQVIESEHGHFPCPQAQPGKEHEDGEVAPSHRRVPVTAAEQGGHRFLFQPAGQASAREPGRGGNRRRQLAVRG